MWYKGDMELLRVGPAAKRIGVHPGTLRRWADEWSGPTALDR